jgi:hypothetical protein
VAVFEEELRREHPELTVTVRGAEDRGDPAPLDPTFGPGIPRRVARSRGEAEG